MLSTDLLAYFRRVSQHTLTIVDLETTGSITYKSRITEIAILQASLAEGIQVQQSNLINPGRAIPARIVEITGITTEMVQDAPVAADVMPQYWPLLQSGILTAHNLDFDYAVLRAEATRQDTVFNRPDDQQLCTVYLSRLMLPDLPSRSLPDLVRHFQFQVGTSHRAAADVMACWLLAKRLLTEIANESDEVLLKQFGQQWLPLKYAAKLLGCSQNAGRSLLEAAGVHPHSLPRGEKTVLMYRRGDVEPIALERRTIKLCHES